MSIFGAHGQSATLLIEFLKGRERQKGHVLVTGISGAGKTFLIKKILDYLGEDSCYVSCSQLFDAETGGTERRLADILLNPSSKKIVILDEIDSIAGKLPNTIANGVEFRVASVLRKCLDTTSALLIGITSRPDIIDPSMTRSGRFCSTVHIGISTMEQRSFLLKEIIPEGILSFDEIQSLARITHGYSAADLEKLYSTTVQDAIKRAGSGKLEMSLADFEMATRQMKPSIILDLPAIPCSHDGTSLVGLDGIKNQILEMMKLSTEKTRILRNLQLSPPRGVLLHGPSGSGKTALALSTAHQSGLNVIHVQVPSILRSHQTAGYFDQIDGLMSTRGTENQTSQNTSDRLITCLLTELDGLQSKKEGDGVFILAATSRKEAIDTAILRPGRIGVHFEMPPFDNEMRLALIEEKIKMMPIDLDSNQIEWIVEKTAGLLPADFDGLFREAALATLRKDFDSQRITFDTLCAQINSSL